MGTTSEKLTYLNTTKSNIKDSIELMGTTILSEDTFRSYADKIKNQLKLYLKENSVETLWNNWNKVSGEGTSLTLNNTMEGKMKIDLKGNTQQNGTPTPDTPIPVQVVSGNNTIKVEGKNLCNGVNQNYFITLQALAGVYQNNSGLIIKVDGVSKYTISTKESQERYRVGCTDTIPQTATANVQVYGYTDKGGTSDSITLDTTGHSYILVNCTDLTAIQVEKGTSSSTYTPYVLQTYSINLGDIELCKIGTYQDKIYKDSGKWYLHKEIGKVVLDGSREWNYISVAQGSLFRNPNDITTNSIVDNDYAPYCNYYLGIPLSQSRANNQIQLNNGSGGSNYHYLDIIDKRFTNASDFKNWLTSNTPVLYYVLAIPTNTEITDSTLLGQLNNLYNANSYEETTNVSQVNDDLASILNVTALEDIS